MTVKGPSSVPARALLFVHRWLGIAGGGLFILWFASGIVLMYVRMPALDLHERLQRLPELDLETAVFSPHEAARRLGLTPRYLRIGTLSERPVYRFLDRSGWRVVFADTGEPLSGLGPGEAMQIARRFAPEHAATIRYDRRLSEADQWTLLSGALLPMHRIALGDPADSRLYVSERTGETVLQTTRRERRLAYLGPISHWLYFTPLRRHSALWLQSVLWLSTLGCVLSLTGLAWGLWRFSLKRRYRRLGVLRRSPYEGLLRWHHYAGLVFGFTTFAFVLSGGLSLDPFNWHPGNAPTTEQRSAMAGGPLDLEAVTVTNLRTGIAAIAESFAVKELEWVQFQGEPFLLAHRSSSTDRSRVAPLQHLLVSAITPEAGTFSAFEESELLEAASRAMPTAIITEATRLSAYDSYYYDRYGDRPLPVLRVRYDDPQQTWLYLDPGRGAIALRAEKRSRLNRWLYHGLHSLDFGFLYSRRPLWDIVVLTLCLGGLFLSTATLVPAFRRLRSHLLRWTIIARRRDG